MARTKKKDHERLEPNNIRKVAELLSDENPITKKEACEILNISYNTKRLQKLIDEQLQKDEAQKRRRKEKWGKPVTEQETVSAVSDFLDGDPISAIAERLARPTNVVKQIIEKVGVPERPKAEERNSVSLLPDECASDSFEENEIVWSAVHHCPATVKKQAVGDQYKKYGANVYIVWVHEAVDLQDDVRYYALSEKGGFTAYVAAYDLGKLEHIRKMGISVK